LQGLSRLANNYQLKIIRLDAAKEVRIKKISLGKEQGGGFETFADFAITLNIAGDYHCLGSFISSLNQLPAIISVESLKVIPHPADNLQQLGTLVIRAYVKK
jgi:Tfp pilus assembly protein PilO